MKKRTRGSGSIFRRGRVYWIAYSSIDGSFRESANTMVKAVAVAKLNDRINKVQRGEFSSLAKKVLVAELMEDVFRDYRINNHRSLRDAEMRWRRHLAPVFANVRAAQVTPDALSKYVDARLVESKMAANGSVNRELALLRRAFNLGEENGKVSRTPKFKMLEESNVRKGFLDEQQYAALADACGKKAPWLLAFFEVAAQLATGVLS